MKNTVRFAAFVLSLTLLSCGGGEHSATDTGSASFGLMFEEASVPAMNLAPSMAPADICSSYGIDSISGTVYNSSNTVIATGGPWACSAHQGTITNIPTGSNICIIIKGTVSGSVVWQGATSGVTIYGGQDTNVGAIPMAYTGNVTTTPATMSFGPANSNAVFWIDQSNPNQNVPLSYQKWGQVFTAPSSSIFLSSASFYVSAQQSATYFMVRLTEWSDVLSQPVGVPLYESGHVLFSTPNTNLPDPISGVRPTVFSVNSTIIPGQKYILEILGDGAVGMVIANGYTGDGLYSANNSNPWSQFGGYALRSDMVFILAP